jgi:hypothetical protein
MTLLSAWYRLRPLRFLIIVGGFLIVGGFAGYLRAVYGTLSLWDVGMRGFIEAANYVSQTISTVGYGNILPKPHRAGAEYNLKMFSSVYSVVAGTAWVLLIDRAFASRE